MKTYFRSDIMFGNTPKNENLGAGCKAELIPPYVIVTVTKKITCRNAIGRWAGDFTHKLELWG